MDSHFVLDASDQRDHRSRPECLSVVSERSVHFIDTFYYIAPRWSPHRKEVPLMYVCPWSRWSVARQWCICDEGTMIQEPLGYPLVFVFLRSFFRRRPPSLTAISKLMPRVSGESLSPLACWRLEYSTYHLSSVDTLWEPKHLGKSI